MSYNFSNPMAWSMLPLAQGMLAQEKAGKIIDKALKM